MQGGLQTIIPHEILQLRHIFGINNDLPNSLHLLSSEKMLYVAGYYAVVFNPKEKEKSQTYYSGAEGYKSITSVCVSSNKKNMAMGLRGETKPVIYYYELNVSAKRKKIEFTEPLLAREWVSIAFTTGNDLKFMASLSSKASGESILAYWNPDKSKCLHYVRISNNPQEKSDLIEVLFSPNSSSSENQLLSVLGEKTFKLYRIVEEEDKTVEVRKITDEITGFEAVGLKSHVYLETSAEILILTDNELVIIDEKAVLQQRIALPLTGTECICSWSEGFLVGGVGGIAVYRAEGKGAYTLKTIIEFDKELSARSVAMFDDKLGAMLSNGQIVQTKLRIDKEQPRLLLEQVGLQYHNGPIVSMDVCIRKPLVATAGKDKAIKIWNYEDRTVETTRNETEAALCLSFHPSGLHLVIAYSDKLRMMNVLKDGETLTGYKDINGFKNCSEIKFSNGGHLFAAVSGTSVHVFKFYTGENPPGMTFTGHTGKIKCIAWSKDDNFLVTCGTDGIILAFRVGMEGLGSKLVYVSNSKESRYKGIGYSCISVTNDNKIYVMGHVPNTNERVLKEISLDGTETKRDLPSLNLSHIAFPSSGRVLIGGVDDRQKSSGSIKCYKFLLSQHVEEFSAHDERGVQKLRITADDKYVVSAGKDGCLMVFEVRDKEAKGDKIKENYVFSNDVLVVKSDLDTVRSEIENLKQEKNELESVQLSSQAPKEQSTKQMRENYISKEQQFAHTYALHLDKKTLQKKRFEEELRATKEKYETDLQGYDSNQSKNVMQESAQYDALKSTQMLENQRYEREINVNKEHYKREIHDLQEEFRKRIKKERDEKTEYQRKIALEQRTHQEIMQSIMEEKEEEINNLNQDNSRKVENLTEATLKANSDVSINKKKINQQENEKERHLERQRENTDETTRLKEQNKALIRDIDHQSLVIQEKDKTIGENERKIYDLKKKSQELEKFKYVLDHKIKTLKRDIGPREKEIAEMKIETNKMDKKLKHYNTINANLAECVSDLLKDEETLKTDINSQRSRISFQTVKIKQFKDAVYQAVQYIQDEERLKEEAVGLSQKFVTHKLSQVKMDTEIEQEYKNQKRYLEKYVAVLKRNLQKDNEIHKHDNVRIMKENVELIKDINKLRMETREGLLKKGPDDERRNKIDPRGEELRQQIRVRKEANDNITEELERLVKELDRLNDEDDGGY